MLLAKLRWWMALVLSGTAIHIDISDTDSIRLAAKTIAAGMVDYYRNNDTGVIYSGIPGYLVLANYYWWECGAMFGALIDYWKYTGDDTYNSLVADGLQFQIGPQADFMPPNASKWMGNDDQGFWALSAMSAAEANFDLPSGGHSWLALAQAVFNEQTSRWDPATCGGGMRWQAYSFLAGWALKNSISNGVYFQLGARLARFTGNDTYAQLASRTFDWMLAVNLIDQQYNVYDNSQADDLNCSQVDHNQWTYNAGTILVGAAYMYNYTNGSALWQNRTTAILNRTVAIMFPSRVMTEIVCELSNSCDTDQDSFKAYLSRWMASTSQLAPYTYDSIIDILRYNAPLAAAQCTGTSTKEATGKNIGTACGLKWDTGTWDGTDGVGQQMAALEVILGTLINDTDVPLTSSTGGNSIGAPGAGSSNNPTTLLQGLPSASYKDKVAASILSTIVCLVILYIAYFLISEQGENSQCVHNAIQALSRITVGENSKSLIPNGGPQDMKTGKNPATSAALLRIPQDDYIRDVPIPDRVYSRAKAEVKRPMLTTSIDESRLSPTLGTSPHDERVSVEERYLKLRYAMMIMHEEPGTDSVERTRADYERVRSARMMGANDGATVATTLAIATLTPLPASPTTKIYSTVNAPVESAAHVDSIVYGECDDSIISCSASFFKRT